MLELNDAQGEEPPMSYIQQTQSPKVTAATASLKRTDNLHTMPFMLQDRVTSELPADRLVPRSRIPGRMREEAIQLVHNP